MSLMFHSKRFWSRLDIGDFSIFTASGGSVGRNFNLDLRPARYFIHDYLATDLAFSLFADLLCQTCVIASAARHYRPVTGEIQIHSKPKLILSNFFGSIWVDLVAPPLIRVQAKARQGGCRCADTTRCERTRMLSLTL